MNISNAILDRELKALLRKTKNHQTIIDEFWEIFSNATVEDLEKIITLLLPDRIRRIQTQSMKTQVTEVERATANLTGSMPPGSAGKIGGMTDKQVKDRIPVLEPYLRDLHNKERQSVDRFGKRTRLVDLSVDDLLFFAEQYEKQASQSTAASTRCKEAAQMLKDRKAYRISDVKQFVQREKIYSKLGDLPKSA